MLIDNKNELTPYQQKTVFGYLEKFFLPEFDFVTGYFTISALARLYAQPEHQKRYRIIPGDLISPLARICNPNRIKKCCT